MTSRKLMETGISHPADTRQKLDRGHGKMQWRLHLAGIFLQQKWSLYLVYLVYLVLTVHLVTMQVAASADGMIVIIALHTALLSPHSSSLCNMAQHRRPDSNNERECQKMFTILSSIRTLQDFQFHSAKLLVTWGSSSLSMSAILYLGDDRTVKRRLCGWLVPGPHCER